MISFVLRREIIITIEGGMYGIDDLLSYRILQHISIGAAVQHGYS